MIQLSDRNSKTKSTNGFQFYKGTMTAKWLPNYGFDKRVKSVKWTLNGDVIRDITNEPPRYNTEITFFGTHLGDNTLDVDITFFDASTVSETITYKAEGEPEVGALWYLMTESGYDAAALVTQNNNDYLLIK